MLKSIALIGNPNCGKTTLFNRLTGANQRIGNWPGVTVEQYQGKYTDPCTKQPVAVVDLPGCYSLVATVDIARDEKVTCDYILQENTNVYINVIDASHLSRDLYLSLQLLELGVPVIVALNCMDLAQAAGIKIDIESLAKALGCPVVPITAKNGSGIKQLQQEISNYSKPNNYKIDYPSVLQNIVTAWQPYCNAAQTIRILEGDELLANRLTVANIDVVAIRSQLQQQLTSDLDVYIAMHRRRTVRNILDTSVVKSVTSKIMLSERVDRVVLHKFFGPVIFLGVMYLMFTCAINLGGWLQVGFESVSETIFVSAIQQGLMNVNAPSWLISLLADGIGSGISITVTFIPVLAAMFLCLGVLESSGYMARAAFIVDRLMRHLGLSGRSFVPMIVGFGCNVPAVMGTRTLSSKRERILTIMMTPFMSCSARLAIYAIFVAAFFPLGGQNVIFSLYVIGIVVAALTGLALRSTILSKDESMSLIEMPDYRWPLFSALLRQVWQRLKSFLLKAGVLIIILNVIINGLGHDVLQNVGKYITPLFAPIGIAAENWPATLGLLTGLIAKEAVVGTLNAFYSSETAMIQYFGGPVEAYAYLLFTLLYFPCVSVVAVIAKELNIKWALFSVAWSTGLAYIIAALFYQIATQNSWLWVVGLSTTLVTFFVIARWVVRKDQKRMTRRKLIPTSVGVSS